MSRAVSQPVALPDLVLTSLAACLLLAGLIAITSASVGYAEAHYGNMWYHAQRHGVYLALASIAGVVAYRVPVEFWYRTAWIWLLLSSPTSKPSRSSTSCTSLVGFQRARYLPDNRL